MMVRNVIVAIKPPITLMGGLGLLGVATESEDINDTNRGVSLNRGFRG